MINEILKIAKIVNNKGIMSNIIESLILSDMSILLNTEITNLLDKKIYIRGNYHALFEFTDDEIIDILSYCQTDEIIDLMKHPKFRHSILENYLDIVDDEQLIYQLSNKHLGKYLDEKCMLKIIDGGYIEKTIHKLYYSSSIILTDLYFNNMINNEIFFKVINLIPKELINRSELDGNTYGYEKFYNCDEKTAKMMIKRYDKLITEYHIEENKTAEEILKILTVMILKYCKPGDQFYKYLLSPEKVGSSVIREIIKNIKSINNEHFGIIDSYFKMSKSNMATMLNMFIDSHSKDIYKEGTMMNKLIQSLIDENRFTIVNHTSFEKLNGDFLDVIKKIRPNKYIWFNHNQGSYYSSKEEDKQICVGHVLNSGIKIDINSNIFRHLGIGPFTLINETDKYNINLQEFIVNFIKEHMNKDGYENLLGGIELDKFTEECYKDEMIKIFVANEML